MAKIDLTKASEKATKQIKGLDKQAEQIASTGVLAPKKVKKNNADYLRFDLRPLGGKDYKAYVEEQARKESVKLGVTISTTKYLHSLIDKDMESQKGAKRTTKTDIIDMLDNLNEQELKAIQGVVKVLCK